MTVVVADTGDLAAIRRFDPRDATTNPSLILAAAQIADYQVLIDRTLRESRERIGAERPAKEVVSEAIDALSVTFGKEILRIIPVSGRVSTEVDARLSYNTEATREKARKLIGLYNAAGIDNSRVLIKIAATWEGIEAAKELEQEGIHCNLTLLFGYGQAVACAEAGVTLVSPFVGRILDWHKKQTGRDHYPGAEDPGVLSVTKIYNYFKTFGYRTEVMGASFRNVDEILELAGCDLLTIAPKFLDQLRSTEGSLQRKLDPHHLPGQTPEKITVDQATFQRMLEEDPMAGEKLDEGIRGFSEAIEALEAQLGRRLEQLRNQQLRNQLAVTEEWMGDDHDSGLRPERTHRPAWAPLAGTAA